MTSFNCLLNAIIRRCQKEYQPLSLVSKYVLGSHLLFALIYNLYICLFTESPGLIKDPFRLDWFAK